MSKKSEFWKDVAGYEGLYQVSNLGRVKSADRTDRYGREFKGKILTPCTDNLGYLHLCLQHDGKRKNVRVHRLVAEAFIDNTNNYNYVNHKDENKQNNEVDNLEWCTAKHNCNYGSRISRIKDKLNLRVIQLTKDGKEIRRWNSIKEATDTLKIRNISQACQGKRNQAGGYLWQYEKKRCV